MDNIITELLLIRYMFDVIVFCYRVHLFIKSTTVVMAFNLNSRESVPLSVE